MVGIRADVVEQILDLAEEIVYDAVGVDENSFNQEMYYVHAELIEKLAKLLEEVGEG